MRLSGIGGYESLKGLGGVKRFSRLVRRPTRLFGYFLFSACLGNRHALGDVKWLVLNTTCHSGLQYRITLDEILDPFVEDLH